MIQTPPLLKRLRWLENNLSENFQIPLHTLPLILGLSLRCKEISAFKYDYRLFCFFKVIFILLCYNFYVVISGGSRPWAKRGGGGFLSLALSAFLPPKILFYFTQNKGGTGPSPTSATVYYPSTVEPVFIRLFYQSPRVTTQYRFDCSENYKNHYLTEW